MVARRAIKAARAATLLLVLTASCSGSGTPRTESGPLGTWTPLSKAPFAVLGGAVWTGDRFVAWGQKLPQKGDGTFGDPRGVAYDPATDRWVEIARSPLSRRASAAMVWAGGRVVVVGGQLEPQGGYTRDGAAYDPSTDRWRAIARAPFDIGGPQLISAGSRAIAWLGEKDPNADEPTRPEGAFYDPSTDRWTTMAKSPLGYRNGSAAVWTGSRMLVWGGDRGGDSETTRGFVDGAAYDPATRRWTMLARWPLSPRLEPKLVWIGDRMVAWGGSVAKKICTDPSAPTPDTCQIEIVQVTDGAIYDSAKESWIAIGAAPLDERTRYDAVAWTGSLLIVWGGDGKDGPLRDGAAYNPATRTWRPLAQALLEPGAYASAWTGSRLLTWGGGCVGDECPPTPQGASFDPSRTD